MYGLFAGNTMTFRKLCCVSIGKDRRDLGQNMIEKEVWFHYTVNAFTLVYWENQIKSYKLARGIKLISRLSCWLQKREVIEKGSPQLPFGVSFRLNLFLIANYSTIILMRTFSFHPGQTHYIEDDRESIGKESFKSFFHHYPHDIL